MWQGRGSPTLLAGLALAFTRLKNAKKQCLFCRLGIFNLLKHTLSGPLGTMYQLTKG